MEVGIKTQEAIAEFRKAVKHGGSLPCFTRDNVVLLMAEFDRLEKLANAPVSAVGSVLPVDRLRPGIAKEIEKLFEEGYQYVLTTRTVYGKLETEWVAKLNGRVIGFGSASSSVAAITEVVDFLTKHREGQRKTPQTSDRRELITIRGEGRDKRKYEHSYVVVDRKLGGYGWSIFTDEDRGSYVARVCCGTGNASTFAGAASAARKAIQDDVNRREDVHSLKNARKWADTTGMAFR